MDAKSQERFAEQLRARRAELLEKVQSTEEDLEVIRSDDQPELEEKAQGLTIARTLDGLDEHDKHEIADIDAALQRIIDGSYGECRRCHQAIARARLEALPETSLCVGCAAAEEAAHPARPRLI